MSRDRLIRSNDPRFGRGRRSRRIGKAVQWDIIENTYDLIWDNTDHLRRSVSDRDLEEVRYALDALRSNVAALEEYLRGRTE